MPGQSIVSILGGIALKGTRWRMVVAVTSLATVMIAPAAHSAPAGCDPSRLSGTHHSDDTSSQSSNSAGCLTYTHPGYGETWLIVTPDFDSGGHHYPGAVMRGGSYPKHSSFPGLVSFGVARSIDEGAHWANLQFAGNSYEPMNNRFGSDPGFYRDPVTNRTFWYGDGSSVAYVSTVVGPMNIMYSDDGGESWTPIADAMNFFPDIFDASHMLGAPATTEASKEALAANGYKTASGDLGNIIYFCGGSTCYKSVDGGVTYGDKAPQKAQAAGQSDGKLYLLSSGQLNVSTDEGATWSAQGSPIPSSLSPGCTRAGGAGALWVDNYNNIYVGGKSDGKLAVAYSKDGGNNWTGPINAQMPEVASSGMCAFMADPDRPGHVAFSYHGATNSTPAPVQHGYLTETDSIFAETPLFTSVQVDSDSDPLLPNGPPNVAGGAANPIPHSVSRFDFMGVYISPVDGRPWGSFAKDQCNQIFCLDQPDTDVFSEDNLQRNYFWTGWLGAVGTMATTP